MGQVQHKARRDRLETPGRQQNDLRQLHQIHLTQALHAGLENLPIAPAGARHAVDVFVIVDLPQRRLSRLVVFHDGQGHIRLQRQQGAVGVRKCDGPLGDQKLLVVEIEGEGLELTHLEGAVAIGPVEPPQLQYGPLLGLEWLSHGIDPPFVPAPAGSRCCRTSGIFSPGRSWRYWLRFVC